MRTTTRTVGLAIATLAFLLLGACERGPNSAVPTAQPSEESFKDFQNYELHYNAVRTDQLTADVAKSYGIQRASNRVMLTITVLRKTGDRQPRVPVEAQVDVDAYNLNGQLKGMEVRRVSEGEAIYYIGEATISGNEILVFDIKVIPSGDQSPREVKFKREFFSN
jgi:hypothetical protein